MSSKKYISISFNSRQFLEGGVVLQRFGDVSGCIVAEVVLGHTVNNKKF